MSNKVKLLADLILLVRHDEMLKNNGDTPGSAENLLAGSRSRVDLEELYGGPNILDALDKLLRAMGETGDAFDILNPDHA